MFPLLLVCFLRLHLKHYKKITLTFVLGSYQDEFVDYPSPFRIQMYILGFLAEKHEGPRGKQEYKRRRGSRMMSWVHVNLIL